MTNFYENINYKKIISAFLIAPLATPLVLMAADLGGGRFNFGIDYMLLFLYVGLIAYLVTASFGIPAYFLFRVLKWSNPLLFAAGGAVIGFTVSLIIFPAGDLWDLLRQYRLLHALAGTLPALVFRTILSVKIDFLLQQISEERSQW